MAAASGPVPPYTVTRRLRPADADAVRALVADETARRGVVPVEPGRLEPALADDASADGFLAALSWDPGHERLQGYVQASRGDAGWDLDIVCRPPAPAAPGDQQANPPHEAPTVPRTAPDEQLAVRLLQAVTSGLAGEDDAPRRLWVFGADRHSDQLAAKFGWQPHREIRQLRRPLPLPDDLAGLATVPTRAFVVGRDEEAWLEVNRRAFAWHPEQGRMGGADLQASQQEAWFDPEGFLLHAPGSGNDAGDLAAFCWTKVHRAVDNPLTGDPDLGEIYVIGVDPAWHGHGLGRQLTVAGLNHLADRGLTVGMLYVESDNEAALKLYDKLGFVTHHVDRVYS